MRDYLAAPSVGTNNFFGFDPKREGHPLFLNSRPLPKRNHTWLDAADRKYENVRE
jgi:hypothetical protein